MPGRHRLLDGLRPLDDRHRHRAQLGQRLDPGRLDPAADRHAGHAGRRCPLRHPERGLAERGLGVDATFAGDHDVRLPELLLEVRQLHDEIDPGPQRERPKAVLDRQQREPDAPGRTGARRLALVAPDPRGQLVGVAREVRVELLDLLRRGPLLRAVGRRRSPRTQQRDW